MDVLPKVKESVKARLDMPGFMDDMIDDVLDKVLDEVVKDTSNPFDDMLKAALYPTVAQLLKKYSREYWEKLLV